MCIIIAKYKNNNILPTTEELTNCFQYNSDGAGFMYTNNGRVIIDKGYMKLNDFLNRFNYLCKKFNNFNNKSLVIHCRIGTSSKNTPENTHPYPISFKEKDLHKTYFITDLGVAHNGIISSYTPALNSTVNDTQKFIMEYLAPVHQNFKTFYKMDKFRDGIQAITNSKFAFLDKKDRLYLVGAFIDENGLKFSNTTYKTLKYDYSNLKTDSYKYDDYFDNYYDKDADLYDEDFEYYDINKNLIYLKNNYIVYDSVSQNYELVEKVKKNECNDLVYDLNNMILYEADEYGRLTELDQNVFVYNERYVLL